MIEVINGFVIDVDERGCTLKRDTGKKDKDGNITYKVYGYYGSIKKTLLACIGFMQKEKLASDTFPLVEAIRAYNQVTERFEYLLDLAIKEAKEED